MHPSPQLTAAIFIGLAGFSIATPIADTSLGSFIRNAGSQQCYYPPDAVCSEYMIPLTITSQETIFNFTRWSDNYGLQQFLADATTRAGAGFPGIVEGQKNVTRDVQIAASFCTPKSPNGKEKNVILAPHGIAAGREHWNSEFKPETYNFVQHAIAEGYSVFFYDRLGCGLSTKLSGYEVQLSQQIVVLRELTDLVRAGKYTSSVGAPEKLALTAFSFGSYITHAALVGTPDIADSVAFTAIGLNLTAGVNGNGLLRSFEPRIASTLDSKRFGELDTGYLSWVDVYGMTLNYFHYPNYEAAAAQYTEDKKQAFSIAEFLTFPAPDYQASSFTGSALEITAETDYIACDGECIGIYKEPFTTYYAHASKLVRHLVPETSHNLNFHESAPETYAYILKFFDENL